jgi:hypothetical protein
VARSGDRSRLVFVGLADVDHGHIAEAFLHLGWLELGDVPAGSGDQIGV